LSSASTASMIPAAAIRCPNAHLNAVAGGAPVPKTRRIAAASEASDCGVPLPCAAIIPTSAARIPASASAASLARERASPSGRIVPDSERAIRLTHAQSLHRLDHGQRAADAVVGDARVCALESVADADMAENVVRQRAQQPHRVDVARKLLAEGGQLFLCDSEQRKIVVLAFVIAAARADVDPRAIAVSRGCVAECCAVRRESRCFARAVRGVEAEQIGAPDQLVELAVVYHVARLEVRD